LQLDLWPDLPQPIDGYIAPPEGPGLGVTVNEDAFLD
jgi:L-alanine-DL-glutamate epimerase-like enolase superfamily enzyme